MTRLHYKTFLIAALLVFSSYIAIWTYLSKPRNELQLSDPSLVFPGRPAQPLQQRRADVSGKTVTKIGNLHYPVKTASKPIPSERAVNVMTRASPPQHPGKILVTASPSQNPGRVVPLAASSLLQQSNKVDNKASSSQLLGKIVLKANPLQHPGRGILNISLPQPPDKAVVRPPNHDEEYHKGLKKILYWNDAYGDPSFFFGFGRAPFLEHRCAVDTCFATHDRALFDLREVDAVLWHLRAKDKSLPEIRSDHTFYVFWMIESALYTYADLNQYNNVFNWTFTYRMDSDFPAPYGRIQHLKTDARERPLRNYAEGKTKMAAWLVSNCNTVSGRETLVRTLQKTLTVDVYGRCGSYNCAQNSSECFNMLEKNYKFYFSFENSLCYDYITEKLFNILKYDIVPVVYGLGYDNMKLPPHSYIDILDFNSVQELSDYLEYLDKNDAAYNEYFRWKSEYIVEMGKSLTAQAFCNICERLHQVYPEPTGEKLNNGGQSTRGGQSPFNRKIGLMENNTDNKPVDVPDDPVYQYRGFESVHDDRNNTIVESSRYRKVYRNLYDWFTWNQCTNPFTNMQLAAFIHGMNLDEIKEETIAGEEEVLPFLLRPNKHKQVAGTMLKEGPLII